MRIVDTSITEPVSLDQVKDIMGYATGVQTDDDLMLRTITEMRSLIEERSGTLMVNRTLTLYPELPKLRVPFRPVTGITYIKCTVDGVQETIDADHIYLWDADGCPVIAFIMPEDTTAIEVKLSAGLSVTPETVKGAIIDLCKARLERQPLEPLFGEVRERLYRYFEEEV